MKVKTHPAIAAALGLVIVTVTTAFEVIAAKAQTSVEARIREIAERSGSTVVFRKEKAERR